MKTILLSIALLSITFMATAQKKDTPKRDAARMLRHVVIFKFKDGTSPEDIKKVEDGFRALPSKIKEVRGFEWGLNNSPENLNQGFTHCFLVTFSSEKDREVYLPHPAHKAFVALLTLYLDKAFVVDYWAGK